MLYKLYHSIRAEISWTTDMDAFTKLRYSLNFWMITAKLSQFLHFSISSSIVHESPYSPIFLIHNDDPRYTNPIIPFRNAHLINKIYRSVHTIHIASQFFNHPTKINAIFCSQSVKSIFCSKTLTLIQQRSAQWRYIHQSNKIMITSDYVHALCFAVTSHPNHDFVDFDETIQVLLWLNSFCWRKEICCQFYLSHLSFSYNIMLNHKHQLDSIRIQHKHQHRCDHTNDVRIVCSWEEVWFGLPELVEGIKDKKSEIKW
jgi:hypothetical protein